VSGATQARVALCRSCRGGGGSRLGREEEGHVGHAGGLGPAVGRRKRVGPKETVQFLIYSKKFKRLELISSKEVLPILHKFQIK
jgi:hypothetical protein